MYQYGVMRERAHRVVCIFCTKGEKKKCKYSERISISLRPPSGQRPEEVIRIQESDQEVAKGERSQEEGVEVRISQRRWGEVKQAVDECHARER